MVTITRHTVSDKRRSFILMLFWGMCILEATFAFPVQTLANTMPTFQITVTPNPIAMLNYFTFTIQQTISSMHPESGYFKCFDPSGAAYLQTGDFALTKAEVDVQAFANDDLSYQNTNFTIHCNLYYFLNGVVIGYPDDFSVAVRQLQIGDSYYRGGLGGTHNTICTNNHEVPYGTPCPTTSTPTPAPVPSIASTAIPTTPTTVHTAPSEKILTSNTPLWLIVLLCLFIIACSFTGIVALKIWLRKRARRVSSTTHHTKYK